MKEKKNKHYLQNDDLYQLICEWKKYKDMENKSKKDLKIEDRLYQKLGRDFMKLANHMAYKPNFINYDRERKNDMISEALLSMSKSIHNFDPEKYENPFSYFTSCTNNAFLAELNGINKTTKQYVKLEYHDGTKIRKVNWPEDKIVKTPEGNFNIMDMKKGQEMILKKANAEILCTFLSIQKFDHLIYVKMNKVENLDKECNNIDEEWD